MNKRQAQAGSVAGPAARPEVATVTSHFKTVFICLFALTILLLGLHVGLAVGISKPNSNQSDLIKVVETGWQIGFSALLGLLGGKAL